MIRILSILMLLMPLICLGQSKKLKNPEEFPIAQPSLDDFVYSQTGGVSKKLKLKAIDSLFNLSDTAAFSNQILSWSLSGPDSVTIAISNGNSIKIPIRDLDADSLNEFQTLSWGALLGDSIMLEISDGNIIKIGIADSDADSTNELQALTQLSDTSFVISGTDDTIQIFVPNIGYQQISISNDTIYLENGGFVVLPLDNDLSNTNEIQNLILIGDSAIAIENGDTILLPESSPSLWQNNGGVLRPSEDVDSIKAESFFEVKSPHGFRLYLADQILNLFGGNQANKSGKIEFIGPDGKIYALGGEILDPSFGVSDSIQLIMTIFDTATFARRGTTVNWDEGFETGNTGPGGVEINRFLVAPDGLVEIAIVDSLGQFVIDIPSNVQGGEIANVDGDGLSRWVRKIWTTATRPDNPFVDQYGMNTAIDQWERWDGTQWTTIFSNNKSIVLDSLNYILTTEYNFALYKNIKASGNTISLPTNIPYDGWKCTIIDGSGTASTRNITIDVDGGTETINGLTSVVINTDRQSYSIVGFIGEGYFIY